MEITEADDEITSKALDFIEDAEDFDDIFIELNKENPDNIEGGYACSVNLVELPEWNYSLVQAFVVFSNSIKTKWTTRTYLLLMRKVNGKIEFEEVAENDLLYIDFDKTIKESYFSDFIDEKSELN